jgi:GNAT superfamily N-acetyltransferase
LHATDDFADRMRRWWDQQSGHRVAWLVRAPHGEAVAMANLLVFTRMPRPGVPDVHWAYVANVWVDPAHRRRGVGRLLMESVVCWAREARMLRVVLNPSEVSVPLYRGLGFTPADNLLRLDL